MQPVGHKKRVGDPPQRWGIIEVLGVPTAACLWSLAHPGGGTVKDPLKVRTVDRSPADCWTLGSGMYRREAHHIESRAWSPSPRAGQSISAESRHDNVENDG